MTDHKNEKECCPEFDPKPWDYMTHEWVDKSFIKKNLPQFLHMPLPFMYARVLGKMWKSARDAGAAPEIKDFLLLAYDPSPWKSELHMSVTKEVADATNVKLSGTYLSKVFDGPYNAVPKWIKVMDKFVSGKGKKVRKYYFYFTTCPKCAKIYGKNYAVAFADVE